MSELESNFKLLWQGNHKPDMSPEETALMGGRLANRLSQIFIAGYQSAVRRTFHVDAERWSALAVSEDRSGELPGLTQDSEGLIQGYKTWVAAADQLDEMIVSVGTLPQGKLYRVPLPTAGVSMALKTDVKFLSDMSQGVAHFDNVTPDALEGLPAVELKQFARREPLYIYLALCGNLQANGHPEAEGLIERLMEVSEDDFSEETHKVIFADVDLRLQELFGSPVERHLESNFEGDSAADWGLISLYSPVIQKRAGRG